MNLYIVRHGQTRLNAEQRVQGRKSALLNDVGIKQAVNRFIFVLNS